MSARKNPQYTLFDVNKYGESPALLFLDIQLESGSRMIEIPIEDIVMVQAIKSTHMIDIYTTSQKIKETLKKMFEILGGDFIYVNKSCIVQNKKIREIDKKNHYALMPGGLKVEVSYREMRNLLRE
ncbi:MAG: LytTR family DNA-binding domain-containing protein [Lachnospiraceae bacterium]|nr:LytTR family transcriptional regulator DNA-binding domain-containing protein [Lachnospiraceae bacterium]MDY2613911.1 LytTR family DNA-binding domain-containing protein [Lachnospiraceae bacterium]